MIQFYLSGLKPYIGNRCFVDPKSGVHWVSFKELVDYSIKLDSAIGPEHHEAWYPDPQDHHPRIPSPPRTLKRDGRYQKDKGGRDERDREDRFSNMSRSQLLAIARAANGMRYGSDHEGGSRGSSPERGLIRERGLSKDM